MYNRTRCQTQIQHLSIPMRFCLVHLPKPGLPLAGFHSAHGLLIVMQSEIINPFWLSCSRRVFSVNLSESRINNGNSQNWPCRQCLNCSIAVLQFMGKMRSWEKCLFELQGNFLLQYLKCPHYKIGSKAARCGHIQVWIHLWFIANIGLSVRHIIFTEIF